MAAGRIVIPNWMPALDSDGEPIPGARMFFYQNETTTLQAIYANENLTATLPNPLSANGSGRFQDVWADTSLTYSVVVDAPYGPPGAPFTYDNVVAGSNGGGGGSDTELRADLAKAVDLPITAAGLLDTTALDITDGFERSMADASRIWYDPVEQRFWGQVGGYQFDNSAPFNWRLFNLMESFYWNAQLGSTDSRTKFLNAYQDLIDRKTVPVLSQATAANDVGASDDVAWMMQGHMRAYELAMAAGNTTLANTARQIASDLLASVRTVFADPGNKNAGLLYVTDANAAQGIGPYRVSSAYELWIAKAALDVDAASAQTTRRAYAKDVYRWYKQYALHPLGVGLNEVDLNPATPGTPKGVNDGGPIKAHFPSTTIAGSFAFMNLCARLYALEGGQTYLQDINAMMAAVLRSDTFLRPGMLFVGDRDGWTNGMAFPEFANLVLPMSNIDQTLAEQVKQVLLNTAVQITKLRTPPYYYSKGKTFGEGFLSADWSGLEVGSNGVMSWWNTGNNRNPDIALPESIATFGSSLAAVTAGRIIKEKWPTIEPVTQFVTVTQMNELLVALVQNLAPTLGEVTFRDSINVEGDLRRDGGYFLGFRNGDRSKPQFVFDNQDFFLFERDINQGSFQNNGAAKFAYNDAGTTTFGGHSVTDRIFASTFYDLETYFGGKNSRRLMNFDSNDYVMFNRPTNEYYFVAGGNVQMKLDASGNMLVRGTVTPSQSIPLPASQDLNPVAVQAIYYTTDNVSGQTPARSFRVEGPTSQVTIRFTRDNNATEGDVNTSNVEIQRNAVVQQTPLGSVEGAFRDITVNAGDILLFRGNIVSNGGRARSTFGLRITNQTTGELVTIVPFDMTADAA